MTSLGAGALALEAEHVTFRYRLSSSPVLAALALTVRVGEMTALIGPNGSGKSTLLRTLSGLLQPQEGRVRLFEEQLSAMNGRQRARRLAFVPQQANFAFPFTVREVVMMGRTPHQGWMGWGGEVDGVQVERCLQLVGLESVADRSVEQLSGGELQRVVLAQALAQQTPVMLLDEPTAHLDLHYQAEVMNLLTALNQREGLTVLVSVHDLNLAALYCRRVVLLDGGSIRADGVPQQIVREDVLRPVYGPHLEVTIHPRTQLPMVSLIRSESASHASVLDADREVKTV